MTRPVSAQDYHAQVLYVPVAVDDPCPFENGPHDDRGISALLESRTYRVSMNAAKLIGPIDIIVADCRTMQPEPGRITAEFKKLRERHSESIFLILIEPDMCWEARLQLKRYGTLCPIGDRADLIVSRLDRLMENLALADECGERLKTLSALNRNNVQGSILETSGSPMRVLVSGAPSPVTLRAMKSLDTDEFRVTAAMSVPQTVRYLELNIFDCLVLLPGERTATYTGLVKMLRRNDRTRGLPILVIPERADGSQIAASSRFMAQGADTVLYAPDTEKALTCEVTAFARRNRLTASMKQFLRKAVSADGDGANLVADLAFFEHHLDRQCERSTETGKPVCLSAFRLKYQSGRRISASAFEQALKYAQMIIRDTDLITSVRDDLFLVVQPGLGQIEAQRRQHNIAEVLQEIILDDQSFDEDDVLIVETSTVLYDAGEPSEALLSRAFRTLQAMPQRRQPIEQPKKPRLTIVR